jgi:hypothetical protein
MRTTATYITRLTWRDCVRPKDANPESSVLSVLGDELEDMNVLFRIEDH